MKSLVTRLMLIALLCYQCRSQSPERHLAYAVDAFIAKMEVLSQRFEEMGNQLNTKVEEMGTQMNIKFEELHERITTMEEMGNQLDTTVEEMGNQLNTKVEEMGTQMNIKFEELHERMTTMEDIQRLEQSILKCSSRNQVSDFQSLFSDECGEGSHNCSTLASCENTLIHYLCSCLPGYEGDGFTCEDVNECSTASGNRCHSQATCTNTAGHFTCSCITGFSGDGFNCEDVDECSTASANRCHSQSTCTNTAGHYTCSCIPGFSGNGFNCEDVDECSTASANRCHSQSTCTNTAGHFTCSCIPGFSGDGFNCEDVDECSTDSANRCHSQSTCTNTAGHYTCSCMQGFSGDGFNCEENVCEPTAKLIESLGCVFPVNALMSWEDAKENCNTKGARLLEGITTQSELDQLKQHFISITQNKYLVWVGMQQGKWIGTGNAIGASSPLWGSGEPESGHADCGMVILFETRPSIGDYYCDLKRPSLCQKS